MEGGWRRRARPVPHADPDIFSTEGVRGCCGDFNADVAPYVGILRLYRKRWGDELDALELRDRFDARICGKRHFDLPRSRTNADDAAERFESALCRIDIGIGPELDDHAYRPCWRRCSRSRHVCGRLPRREGRIDLDVCGALIEGDHMLDCVDPLRRAHEIFDIVVVDLGRVGGAGAAGSFTDFYAVARKRLALRLRYASFEIDDHALTGDGLVDGSGSCRLLGFTGRCRWSLRAFQHGAAKTLRRPLRRGRGLGRLARGICFRWGLGLRRRRLRG